MKSRIIYLLGSLLLVAGVFTQCKKDNDGLTEDQKTFLNKTTYGVYGGTSDMFTYSENSCQYVLGGSVKSTRVQTDDASKYFSVTFPDTPSADAEMTVVMASKGISGAASGSVKIKVLKLEDNRIWIWDTSGNKGYVAPWK